MWAAYARTAAAAGVAGIGIAATVDEDFRNTSVATVKGGARFIRTSYNAALVAADYKWHLRHVERGDPEYEAIASEVHGRAAARLLNVCRAHGGVYTKFGQYIASMNHVLPPAYIETLAVLQDKAPFVELKAVKKVIKQETGKPLEALYSEFDELPIAAASLAQVHRAVTTDGQEVAVKIQYPGLERQVGDDMITMRVLATVLGKLFPAFEYTWLLPDFEESLTQELDFRQEAYNAMRVARMFAKNKDVHVPTIRQDLTHKRMLTMEFIRGCKVNDVEALESMGIKPIQVAHVATRVFGDMIHYHGFVHCDPHPGNLMVRKDPSGRQKFQLVVLDHGMYRRLDPEFRAAYCRLWKAMLLRDLDATKDAATQLGLGKFAHILPLILMYRSVESKSPLSKGMTVEERQKLHSDASKVSMVDVNRFMRALPRDLLFVLRSTNLVRSLNRTLGGSTRQRLRVLAESAIRGLVLADDVRPERADIIVDAKHSINEPVDSELEVTRQRGTWGSLKERASVLWLRSVVLMIDAWLGFRFWYDERDEYAGRHGEMG